MIDNHDQPLAGVNETSQDSTPSSANINCTEIHQTLGRVMDLLTPLMNKLEKQTKHTGHVQQQMNEVTDSCSSFSNVAVIHDDTNMTRIEFPKDLINNLKLINDMKLPSVGKEDASFRCDKNVFYTSSKNSIVFPETAVDHLKDALLFIGIKENDSFQVLTNVTPKSKLITAEINPGQNKNDFLVGNEKYYNIRNEAFQLLLILPSSPTVGILSAKLKLLAHPSSSSSPSRKKDTKTLLASNHRDDEESIINNNDSHDGIGNHAGNSSHELETTAPSTSTTAVVEGQQNNVIKDPASIDFSEVDKSSLNTTAFPLCTGQLEGYDRGSKDDIYKEPSQEAFKWLLDSPLGKRLKQAGYEHLLCGLLTPKAVEYLPMLTSEWERDTKDKCCPRVGQCCKKDQTSAQTPRDYIQEYPRNSREVLEKSFTRISRIFADLRLSSCLYFVSFEAAGKDPVRGGPGRISRFVIQMLLKLSPSYVQPTITKYFLELYEKYLKELEEKSADRQELLNDLFGLNDDSAASVSELYIMIRTLIASGHPLDSPFLQRCIQKKLLERVNALDMNDDLNGSIPYPYCVNLKGVPDESETLKENEVFISSSYMRRILGNAKLCSLKNVLVFRYPLAHQHDIRKLVVKTWSNHEFLNSSENSIVFSKTGAPQQWMGGGDLDGDIYSILFDPNLVEQFDSNAKTFINYNHEVKKLFNGYSENSANLSYEESRKEQALYFFKRDSQTGLFYSKIEANLFCRQLVEEEEQKLAIYHTASIDEQKTNQHKDLKTLETKNMKNLIMSPKLLNNLGEDRFETKLKKLFQKYSQKFGVFGGTCDKNAFVKTYVTRFSPETENNELTIQDVDEFLNCHQQYSENYKKEYKRLLELNPKNRNNKALNKQLIPMLVKQERPNDSRAFFALEIYKTQFAPLPFDACLKKVITWMRIAHSPTYTSEERIEFCYVVCYPWIIRMDKELTLNQGEHWNHYSMIHSLYGHHL
ncbi:hypothetical protein C9374_004081 [Naegleria lovaniensis]|uniref:RNA-dependent RNA polymerase n=1 Tax=Naegleria lovaniensis TaxID=51637 RepID=A0AA88GN42_NAELO|nr:uncharacterized protein C9374_004081 [Naegleria lovaniensis]KAG2383410.1 hypothetical protein C9374_004081 [Naegleria lovaniensis]